MPKVRKGRSRIALLATIAVLASLFVLPAAPAYAGAPPVGTVEFEADFSACVGDATADAGFGDTSGSFADAAIDCIAYYGVTQGTSAGVYSPADGVTREQMALFLVRAAGPAGITVPAAADQGLTDIAGLPQASQDAINQLVALGISQGIGGNEYGPADIVSRYQMALFLIRFLEVQNGTATLATGEALAGFTDTSQVSNEAFLAIEKAYDHGITTGTTSTTFSPFDAVTREQMAAFITRTLAWTNARPAGVTIQASKTADSGAFSTKVQVSVRDADFMPSANALADVFGVTVDTPATPAAPVNSDGTGNTGATGFASVSGTPFTIANSDFVMNASGNAEVTPTVADGKTVTWWAWTGAVGATFDLDTTDVSAVTAVSTEAATAYTAKANTNANATAGVDTSTGTAVPVKFGSSVTVTFQTTDGTDALAQSGVEITVTQTRKDGTNTTVSTSKVTTDAAGAASFAIPTASDPNTATGDYVNVSLSFADDAGLTDPGNVEIEFSDDAASLQMIDLSQSADYDTVKTAAVNRTVTATAYDQYGVGIGGVELDFANSGASAADSGSAFTNSAGVASYTYLGGNVNGVDTVAVEDAATGGVTDSLDFVWAATAATGDTGDVTDVMFDLDADKFVGDQGGTYRIFSYDSGDVFQDNATFKDLAALETAEPTAVTVVQYNTSGVSSFRWNVPA